MAQRTMITDALEKRVEMVNGYFDLSAETLQAMKDVRAASEAYARALHEIFKRGLPVDTGRAIATIDHVQLCKNMACDALILPNASK
jgi:hypothetical protein